MLACRRSSAVQATRGRDAVMMQIGKTVSGDWMSRLAAPVTGARAACLGIALIGLIFIGLAGTTIRTARAAPIMVPPAGVTATKADPAMTRVQGTYDDSWSSRRFQPRVAPKPRYRYPWYRRPAPTARRPYPTYQTRPYSGRSPSYRRRGVPLSHVVRRVRSQYRGKVLGARVWGRAYRIRVLRNDGRIVYVYADRQTGRILSVRGGR